MSDIVKKLRNTLKILLPSPDDAHKVIMPVYGRGYKMDKRIFAALRPPIEEQIFSLTNVPR